MDEHEKTRLKVLEQLKDVAVESLDAKKAFAYAIISQGLHGAPRDESDCERDTALNSMAARVWYLATMGDMKAIQLIRDTIDGLPTQKIEQKVDVNSRTEHDAMLGRISQSLLTLRPVTIEQVAPEKKLLN